jgi:hypothetical protein
MRWRSITGTGEYACAHGTAIDVHCCNCHSGFLFDIDACVCGFEPPTIRKTAPCLGLDDTPLSAAAVDPVDGGTTE